MEWSKQLSAASDSIDLFVQYEARDYASLDNFAVFNKDFDPKHPPNTSDPRLTITCSFSSSNSEAEDETSHKKCGALVVQSIQSRVIDIDECQMTSSDVLRSGPLRNEVLPPLCCDEAQAQRLQQSLRKPGGWHTVRSVPNRHDLSHPDPAVSDVSSIDAKSWSVGSVYNEAEHVVPFQDSERRMAPRVARRSSEPLPSSIAELEAQFPRLSSRHQLIQQHRYPQMREQDLGLRLIQNQASELAALDESYERASSDKYSVVLDGESAEVVFSSDNQPVGNLVGNASRNQNDGREGAENRTGVRTTTLPYTIDAISYSIGQSAGDSNTAITTNFLSGDDELVDPTQMSCHDERFPKMIVIRNEVVDTITTEETSIANRSENCLSYLSRETTYRLHNPFIRQGRLMDLDLFINDIKFTTIPDTGAHINAIPLSTLNIIKQRIEKQGSSNGIIRLGNDKSTGSMFRVVLYCRLPKLYPGRSHSVTVVFHVFEKLASGVAAIVGYQFLQSTQILTTQSFRLKSRYLSTQQIPRCMSIGPLLSSGLRFRLFLDRRPILALPDTGSEINLVSRACALKNGFNIISLSEDELRQVEFADGAIQDVIEKVIVTVHAADCSLSVPQARSSSTRVMTTAARLKAQLDVTVQTFFVLDSLAHDVILGQWSLYSMDAWNRYPAAFEVVVAPANGADLCTIFSNKPLRNNRPKTEETVSQCKQRENARVSRVNLKREAMEERLKQARGNAAKTQEVQQELDELSRTDTADHNAYLLALSGLTSTP